MKNDYLPPIVPGAYYHLYNRTNNKEALFLGEENRLYFLQQYRYYLEAFTDTYAYCLLDNHFHLFVRVKALDEFISSTLTNGTENLTRHQKTLLRDASFDELLQLQFRRFFTSYSMAFNTMWNRNGNLFHRPFKRVLVEDEAQYSRLVFIFTITLSNMVLSVIFVYGNGLRIKPICQMLRRVLRSRTC
ncbi:hypothetical protein [Paraflavitalea speifideaquila]|uniref:hypothetical protein n=1 Tax=Paraflavitalea speifideaquila TaxID=3076558 RepID=UPI0028E8070A|nr:hypothetical protein [Paraflavitalea speifideiaquila]